MDITTDFSQRTPVISLLGGGEVRVEKRMVLTAFLDDIRLKITPTSTKLQNVKVLATSLDVDEFRKSAGRYNML